MSFCKIHETRLVKKELGPGYTTFVCPYCEIKKKNERRKQKNKIDLKVLEIYESLLKVVQNAGGAISGFTIDRLKFMSAYDLLEGLGPNSIRFVYNNSKPNPNIIPSTYDVVTEGYDPSKI